MATLGRVTVDLVARTAQFQQGMTRAQGIMAGFSRGINMMTASMATRLAPLALAAGIYRMMSNRIREIIDVSKQSVKLGIAAADYQMLAKAADETGTSIEAIAAAMQKSFRIIGEASLSGKASIFDSLGLDPKALAKMGRMEAFMAIIDRLGRVKNEFARAALAQEIFGRGAGEMRPLIEGGSAALEDYRKEIRATGNAIDEATEASTRSFTESLDRMWMSTKGFFSEAWELLAPWAEKVAQTLEVVGLLFSGTFTMLAMLANRALQYWSKFAAVVFKGLAMLAPVGRDRFRKMSEGAEKAANIFGLTVDDLRTQIAGKEGNLVEDPNSIFGRLRAATDRLMGRSEGMQENLQKQRGKAGGGPLDELLGGAGRGHEREFKQVESLKRMASIGPAGMGRVGGNPIQWNRGEELLEKIAANTGGIQPVLV